MQLKYLVYLSGEGNWDDLAASVIMKHRVKKKLERFIDGVQQRGSRKSKLTILGD